MKSRYQGLHTIGTLSLILAWIVLVLGIIWAIASFAGLNALRNTLAELDLAIPGVVSWAGALPAVLFAIFGFLQFYVIGKVLHLLVDVDSRTQAMADQPQPQVTAVTAPEAGVEISGELKRQATLIASTLEATQGLQRQVSSLENKLAAPAAPVVTIVPDSPSAESAGS